MRPSMHANTSTTCLHHHFTIRHRTEGSFTLALSSKTALIQVWTLRVTPNTPAPALFCATVSPSRSAPTLFRPILCRAIWTAGATIDHLSQSSSTATPASYRTRVSSPWSPIRAQWIGAGMQMQPSKGRNLPRSASRFLPDRSTHASPQSMLCDPEELAALCYSQARRSFTHIYRSTET